MIIRSQNKQCIINLKSIVGLCTYLKREEHGEIRENYDTEIIYHSSDGKLSNSLGEYSSTKKAIKVLDMICEEYQKCRDRQSGLRRVADTYFVFQMPQDSEVQI